MRVAILGPLQIRTDDGRAVTVNGVRVRSLLIRLALTPGTVVSLARLIQDLWDEPPNSATNALQALVSRLRRNLGDPALIESHANGYRLAVSPGDIDVSQFSDQARAGRAALETDPRSAAHILRDALALWRGPALLDAADAPFAQPEIAHLTNERLSTLEDRIEADLTLGRSSLIIAELESLAAEHPTRERIQGQLMRALAAIGRQADALGVYERTRRLLTETLGIDPSPELSGVHLDVLRQFDGLDAPRTNLRSQLTSFVGRDEDIARIGKLFDETRLVTLVGPGGAGKTRLAVEAAGRLAPRLSDGVWMVELAPMREESEIAQALLHVLGLRERALLETRTAAQDAMDRLTSSLRDKDMVLILDNCEHLLTPVALVAYRLLGSCAQLKILATSREPLGVPGETLSPVPPLAMPALNGPIDAASALSYPAVRLFADRAAAVRPGFEVNDSTVEPTLAICHELDGMPLAIELAAARLRALSVESVASRLSDRFRLLTGGNRTALPRHQTLRAVVDWSWDLLSEPERILLRRLSVFVGGATAEAVESICADDTLPASEIFDLLTALVDKSLLESNGSPERFRMLETVRVYSAQRLDAVGEVERFRAVHARYFLDLAVEADPHLRQAEQLEWLALLSADYENILATLRWSVDRGDAHTAFVLGSNLIWFWMLRGNLADAHLWASEIVEVPGDAPAEARALVFAVHSVVSINSDQDLPTALRSLATALWISRPLTRAGDHPLLLIIEFTAALITNNRRRFADLVKKFPRYRDPWIIAMGKVLHGVQADNAARPAQADEAFTAAAEAFGEIGDRWGLATSLASVARLRDLRGDFTGAIEAYTRALGLTRELDTRDDIPHLMVHLGLVRLRSGDLDGARRDIDNGLALAIRNGITDATSAGYAALGELARRRGDVAQARELYDEALEIARRDPNSYSPHRPTPLLGMAQLALDTGEFDAARIHVREAFDLSDNDMDPTALSVPATILGMIEIAAGDPEPGVRVLGAAEAIRGARDCGNPELAIAIAAARTALGDERYEAAYRSGAELSSEAARDLVRAAVPPATTPPQ